MRSRRPTFQTWVSALLLPCYLAACTSWHRDTRPLPVALAAAPAPGLRFTLVNGERITLTDPQQVGDSVVGIQKPTLEQLRDPTTRDKHPRVAIPLADIQTVERANTSAVKTMVVVPVLGLAGLVGIFMYLGFRCQSSTSC